MQILNSVSVTRTLSSVILARRFHRRSPQAKQLYICQACLKTTVHLIRLLVCCCRTFLTSFSSLSAFFLIQTSKCLILLQLCSCCSTKERMGPQNEEPVVSRRACVVRTVHKCPMPECTYISDRRSNVERHYATMHVNCLPLQQASCCGLNFIDKQAYRTHQKTAHTLGYCCGTCGKRFKTKHHYSLHSGTHDRAHNFFCTYPECGYNTSRKGNFRRHIAVHDAALIRDAGISLSSNDFGDSSAAFGFPPNIQGIPEFADGSGRSEYAAATDNRNVNVPEMPRTDGANDIYTTQQDYEKCEGYGSNGDMGPLEGQLDENSVVQNAEPLKGFPCRMCNKRFAMWKHAFKHVCTCG